MIQASTESFGVWVDAWCDDHGVTADSGLGVDMHEAIAELEQWLKANGVDYATDDLAEERARWSGVHPRINAEN